MARARARRSAYEPARAPARRLDLRWAIALPVAVSVVLCLPRLSLGYFWDDYLFLTGRGHGGPAHFLTPDPGVAFYRPLVQGFYFMLLKAVDPAGGGLFGHVVNLAALAGAIALLVLLVSELSGPRAGLLAGLVFAAYGHVASLVAWVSCSQDLFAILLVLASFWFRHRRADVPAFLCATAAILCKEPAIAAVPVLVGWDWIVGRPSSGWKGRAAAYAAVLAAWAAVHPGVHLLLASHGLRTGGTGYLGMEHPERWGTYLARYAMTLANLPPIGFTTPWPDDLSLAGFVALALLLGGLFAFDRGPAPPARPDAAVEPRRVAWLGALFGVPALLMPAILVRHWAPYFACIPAAGAALAAAPWLAARSKPALLFVLALFLLLGVWCRGIVAREEPVWSEPVFVGAARAAATVRDRFRFLAPEFPPGSQIVVSCATTGERGIYGTLIDNQALQIWYRDPTLRTVTPLARRPGAPAEFLFRVTSDLEVLALDPDARRVRSSSPQAPDLSEIDRPLRNYARAVAAEGDPARAIRILEGLRQVGPPEARAYEARLVAHVLLREGRTGEARAILDSLPALGREEALALVHRLLAEASSSESLDLSAFAAFGLSADDPGAVRAMMRRFRDEGSTAQAAWWAGRLARLAPGDPEAAAVAREAARNGIAASRLPG